MTRFVLILGFCTAGVCAFAAGPAVPARPVIVASIPPQAWVLDQLGATEACDVQVLLPPASGHINYSPSPSQVRDLARARLFVRSGLPFEDRVWDRIRSLNPGMAVVDAPEADGDEDHGHDHGPEHEHDPHFWLDPLLMLEQAERVAAVLPEAAGLDPKTVQARLSALRERVLDLDSRIGAILRESDRDSFWTFHGSWGHFAEHYGMKQYSIKFEGKESGFRTMLGVVADLEASGADFILVEPGMDPERLSMLQNEVELRFVELNPLRREYDQGLLEAAEAIAEGGR